MVTGSYPPMKCGVGDYTHQLVKALAQDGSTQIHVLTSSANTIERESGVDVQNIMSWRGREIFKYIKFLFKIKPDLVHIQYPTQGYGGGLLPLVLSLVAYVMGFKVIQTWHEFYDREYFMALFPRMITPGGLIFVRQNYLEKLDKAYRWALFNKQKKFIRNASSIPVSKLNESERASRRAQLLKGKERLIFYFGFLSPVKGVEDLFEIADPKTDLLVIAGDINSNDEYHAKILQLANSEKWKYSCSLVGYLSEVEIADFLRMSDAVVLPFVNGVGSWNSTLHAAHRNGAFVVTTSDNLRGYDKTVNTFFAEIKSIEELRKGLQYCGGLFNDLSQQDDWREIADEHLRFYKKILGLNQI
jgi:glycosyltransferase involved in cell wall biosynthesis